MKASKSYPRIVWHAELLALDLSGDDTATKLGMWINATNDDDSLRDAEEIEARRGFADGFLFGMQQREKTQKEEVLKVVELLDPAPTLPSIPQPAVAWTSTRVESASAVVKPSLKTVSAPPPAKVFRSEPISAPMAKSSVRVESALTQTAKPAVRYEPISVQPSRSSIRMESSPVQAKAAPRAEPTMATVRPTLKNEPISTSTTKTKVEALIMPVAQSPVKIDAAQQSAVMGSKTQVQRTMPIVRPGPPAPGAMAPVKLGTAVPIVTTMSPNVVDSTMIPGAGSSPGAGDQTPFPAGLSSSGTLGAAQKVTIVEKKMSPADALVEKK